ncbi:hypothetical protein ISX56_27725 [Serratia ureilytica]|nr:hypothetical protein [Serratia ureilytica]
MRRKTVMRGMVYLRLMRTGFKVTAGFYFVNKNTRQKMKQSEVREEVAMIVKAIKESESDIPSFVEGDASCTYIYSSGAFNLDCWGGEFCST